MRNLGLIALVACSGSDKLDTGWSGSAADGVSDADTDTDTDADVPTAEFLSDDEPPLLDTGTGACDTTTPVVLYVSPDDSNSLSSPVQARSSVLDNDGAVLSPIRKWEFFNYYDLDYPPAPSADALAISVDLAPTGNAGEYTFQVGVSSAELVERAPLNVTFVLDDSCSMSGLPNEMLKSVGHTIAAQLRDGDRVSAVTWDTVQSASLEDHVITGPDDPVLLAVFDSLDTTGGTDLGAGLAAGYALADSMFDPARINRVILVSDGGANAGVTDAELIGAAAGGQDEAGIYLVGVGVGDAGYNDELMDVVTDYGKGASVFVPSVEESTRMFRDRFLEVLDVAARNVQISYELPPGFEVVHFSGEEIGTTAASVDPQHIAPNDAMVLHQVIATCDPEGVVDASPLSVVVTWQDAITFAPREARLDTTFGAVLGDPGPRLLEGIAIAAYVEALRAVSDAAPDAGVKVAEALAAVDSALAVEPDPDLDEIRTVLSAL
jgi:Ca-activated chloride channel homolog